MKFFNQGFAALLAALSLTGAAHAGFVTVGTSAENRIQTDTRWTRDNVYILSRVIFVDNGATLTIEPGTIIRGVGDTLTGISGEPSSLVIARGGKIIANGTADDPIYFTSIDDPNVPGGAATIPATWTNAGGTVITVTGSGRHASLTANDYSADGLEGDNGFAKSERWGGIVICGKAYCGAGTQAGPDTSPADGIWDGHAAGLTDAVTQNGGVGTDYVEGLSSASGSTVLNSPLAIYGGLDDNDNSGVMRFVSMRYGGFVIGAAATGNEINGLTLCGVGQATTLEHLEVFQNQDDGFEWFGGKHNTRFMFSLSNQDDLFDGDEGMRGTHQFWLGVQGTQSTSTNVADVVRSGFTNNDYIGQENTASDYRYDKTMEFDGAEGSNGDRLPTTEFYVTNVTLLAGNTQKRGMNPKDEAHLYMHNLIHEGSNNVIAPTANTAGTIIPLLATSNVHSNEYTGATSQGTTSGSNVSDVAPLFAEETTSQIASNWNESANVGVGSTSDLYTKNGFDPRGASGSNALIEDGTFVPPAGFVVANYAGAMRDNNFLGGWSVLEWLQVLPATNTARPELTIGAAGGNPTISFATASATVKYVIEKSTDGGKNWTVLTTTPVTNPTTVSHTDTTTTIGSPVLYRAYAL
jgi:hypothetical protein